MGRYAERHSPTTLDADAREGWSDASLSNHGMNQARALAQYFSKTKFSAIYCSDLLRAHTTAETLRDSQPAFANPLHSDQTSSATTETYQTPFIVSPLLREQNFGVAEGNQWSWSPDPQLTTEEHYARGVYPAITDRSGKFPEGESLDDLASRADRVLDELLLPEVWKAIESGERGVMIAVVSHGLCITYDRAYSLWCSLLTCTQCRELMSAFMRRDCGLGDNMGGRYRGMMNTGWHRILVEMKVMPFYGLSSHRMFTSIAIASRSRLVAKFLSFRTRIVPSWLFM
jgi:broad specificity phosphatase PhoE